MSYGTLSIRDWSLIMGMGVLQNERGACEVLPLRKGVAEKSVSHAKGGGAKSFHSLRGGGEKLDPVLRWGGGAQKVSDPRFPHFVAPIPRN